MSKKTKWIALVMVVFVMGLYFTACSGGGESNSNTSDEVSSEKSSNNSDESNTSSEKKIKIGATFQNLQNEYIKNLADYSKAKAEELGLEWLEADGQGQAENQISQVENFIAQGVDAIILNPFDRDGCAPIIDKCNAENIPVVVVCSVVTNLDKATAFVGSDDVNAGRIEMQFIADKIGGKGNIAVIHGPTGHSAEINRTKGIYEVLEKYPDIKVIFEQPADWDRAKAMSLVENWLQTGKELNAIVSQNDEMALGAYKAVEAAGKAGEIKIIGIDAIPDALKSVKEGKLDATVFQDAKGQAEKSVEVAVMAAKGEKVEKHYDIPFQLITKENVDEFLK